MLRTHLIYSQLLGGYCLYANYDLSQLLMTAFGFRKSTGAVKEGGG